MIRSEPTFVGDLFDLCRGEVAGRRADDEITLFKSVGTALEDLAAARLAFAKYGHCGLSPADARRARRPPAAPAMLRA